MDGVTDGQVKAAGGCPAVCIVGRGGLQVKLLQDLDLPERRPGRGRPAGRVTDLVFGHRRAEGHKIEAVTSEPGAIQIITADAHRVTCRPQPERQGDKGAHIAGGAHRGQNELERHGSVARLDRGE